MCKIGENKEGKKGGRKGEGRCKRKISMGQVEVISPPCTHLVLNTFHIHVSGKKSLISESSVGSSSTGSTGTESDSGRT